MTPSGPTRPQDAPETHPGVPSRGRSTLPYRILILLGLPALVLILFHFNAPRLPSEAALGQLADAWSAAFESMLLEAQSIAVLAEAEGSDAEGPEAPPTPSRSSIASRLEGRGVVDPDRGYVRWEGAPAEVPADFMDPSSPAWRVRIDPVKTRLIVRAAPDAEGRQALATFVLTSAVLEQDLETLFPARLRDGIQSHIRFTESGATLPNSDDPPPEPDLRGPPIDALSTLPSFSAQLKAPDGTRLGVATLSPLDPELRGRRYAAAGRATALLLFLTLSVLLFGWRHIVRSALGFTATVVALLAARVALIQVDVPASLFPRELGGASLFGSSQGFGWIASPVDLLLTGFGVYLFSVATRGYCRQLGRSQSTPAALLALLAATSLSALGIFLCGPLARDSRMPLLERQALIEGDARSLLLIGFVLLLMSAAELWGIAWFLRKQHPTDTRPGRGPVAVGLLCLSVICGVAIQRQDQDLALERLRSEFAPLVLEQSPRRELALMEAVRHVYDAYQDPEHPIHDTDTPPEHLAYQFWVDSSLFATGYKSSLDFFNSSGDLISHFAFDLPLLQESLQPPVDGGQLTTREEEFEPVPALDQEIFHAETAVFSRGEYLGTVVGHVLDEADNLPFLPQSRPYLAALGAGRRHGDRRGSVDSWEDPQYVLYNEFGTVRQSTLLRPPTVTDALRKAGLAQEVVKVMSGDDSYVGLALADRGRLHLLLVPTRGVFVQAAAAVRLSLLGLLVLALFTVVPNLLRGRSPWPWQGRVRHSFYGKLLMSLLLASILPLLGLSLILQRYVERQGDAALNDAATRYVRVAQHVLEDYLAVEAQDEALEREDGESALEDRHAPSPQRLDDDILHWLRRVVGQEIHVFSNGVLQATSKRELYSAGLLPLRIDGEIHRQLVEEGRPSVVTRTPIGKGTVPVAYAPLRTPDIHQALVVAVPIVLEQRQIARAIDRLMQVALLATVALVGVLALFAAFLARSVAQPVKELVDATGQISAGDYETRLLPSTQDEIGELVLGFNSMATALSRQRSDLERRREYMEKLLHHATTGVISTDSSGRIVTLNPAARELLSAAAPALEAGVVLTDALATSPPLRPLAQALAAPRAGTSEPHEVDFEREQKPRRFRFVRIALPEPGGAGTLILIDDVTELMRSNQLAAWAEMARAIAHEIKNPLTPIQLSTEHLRRLLTDRRVLPSPEIEACIETVIKQVRSLHEIAGEFSTYAKLPALAPESADPVALMRGVIGPYRAAHPPGISIRTDFVDADTISVDRRVLSRALINLIENALQAMPDGGTLTVGVRPHSDPRLVELSVRDTGTGLDAEVKRRLFEPYFSTKSSGTGLGLAIVQRAVEAHRGRIEVDSAAGEGTTMRILVPVAGILTT